jgi:hypothetical protein
LISSRRVFAPAGRSAERFGSGTSTRLERQQAAADTDASPDNAIHNSSQALTDHPRRPNVSPIRLATTIVVPALLLLASATAAADRFPGLPPEQQPADALANRFRSKIPFSAALGDGASDELAARWKLARTDAGRTATDPSTGLVLRQQIVFTPLPDLFLLKTTVSNTGSAPLKLKRVAPVDWLFQVEDVQNNARYRPLEHRNDKWYGSTYWSGPDWTRVGKDWHHPGKATPAVRRFTAPKSGKLTVAGRIYKADTKPSDGVHLEIRHNAETVWTADLDGQDGKGVEPKLHLQVERGDALRFVVHKRKAIYCDTTHWDPVITYADGQSFQASKGFSKKRQGHGGWSYEMEGGDGQDIGLPSVHVLSANLQTERRTPALDQSVVCDSRQTAGMFLLAGATDQSGIGVAVGGDRHWRFEAKLQDDGHMRVRVEVPMSEQHRTVQPGQSVPLPPIAVMLYDGPADQGMLELQQAVCRAETTPELAQLQQKLDRVLARSVAPLDEKLLPNPAAAGELPERDLWVMLQADWRRQDKLDGTPAAYRTAIETHVQKARLLLEDLQKEHGPGFCAAEAEQLRRIEAAVNHAGDDEARLADLHTRLRWTKRQIILANPLLDFGPLLFCKRVPTSYSHLVMQYYGWRARPGGGLFVLERPGRSLACRDILQGKLSGGNVLEPRLSYDGRRIVFSYVECPEGPLSPSEIDYGGPDVGYYHIYEVNVDGTGLRQLTSGPFDDLMPAYLPDGGIAFCSTRRRGYARCFGGQFSKRWDVYTLHRMNGDGSGIRTLSFHDTNEWFPTVSNSGHILYARWDYIDRDAVTHQNLWASRPDGTNPIAVWGNATPKPHCTFQPQPIPGSDKIVFAASAHHSVTGGPIVVLDPSVSVDGQEPLTSITPQIPYPEAETRDIREYYTAPWPLSEKYFLVGYSPEPLVWEPGAQPADALGLYVLDVFGNRELVYRDPKIGSTNPCPLRPRPMPPALPSMLPKNPPSSGEFVVADVYEGLGDVPRGTIKELRVVQIFTKTTNVANSPPIGMAREENARAILGTVPVEADGSARFQVPAGKLVLFQALDEDGFAYQTMRSGTYLQPGEKVACVGCHEQRMSSPVKIPAATPLAMQRPASQLDPGPMGGRPWSYMSMVQPVLDKHCVRCHGGEKTEADLDLTAKPEGAFCRSYVALCQDDRLFWGRGTNPQTAAEAWVPRFGGRNQVQVTPPGGLYGARGSRLIHMLRRGHHDVKLSADDFRRLGTWIDMNATFYGVYLPEDQARQLRGEDVPMPEIQ